ncbi:hypothetical protein D9757_007644 [Collybiopsis confluens]|uniref:rRNA N-glycosylase n=1 Tax=Collybiopsis confluens TaxID=2823264 RepID=A0A8H5M3H1_9AGAR|nr:hypothetical protein D9757_007644 [Collybiopsis confluens]
MTNIPTAFDFDDGEDVYNTFIEALRNGLAAGNRVQGVPILPAQQGAPQTFDLNLTADGSTVRVRFRRDNLYLIGYQANNIWYEVAHETGGTHLIGGSTFLPFQGNYNLLARPSAADRNLRDVPLSVGAVNEAIRALAQNNPITGTGEQRRAVARAIFTLAVVISEATSFACLWSRIRFMNVQRSPESQLPGHDLTSLACHPSLISLQPSARWYHALVRWERTGHSLTRRSITDAALATSFIKGQPLLEIFYVTVNNIDDENPGDLFGSIRVTDSAGTVTIWNRGSRDWIEIKPGGRILLEGPSRPLYAADLWSIDLDLWDHDQDASPNDPIAQGTISFNPYGSVTVSYVVIADALYAEISVILINGDGENPADVYGNISADGGYGVSELFRKSSEEYREVKPGSPIPLSKTVVAVPTKNTLRINANLWDYDTIGFDDEITKGSADFQPLYKQSAKKRISGKYGEIEVRVMWM